MKVKEESEKASLKLNIQKTKIMASGPITYTNRRQASYLWKKREVEIRKLCKSDMMKAKNRKGKIKIYFALSSVHVQIPSIFHESIFMTFLEALLFSTVIKLWCFFHN